MVVAFSSLTRILGECSTIYSPPALFFFQEGEEGDVVEMSSFKLISFFPSGSVHSGLAS